jgi:hypothetical protein
MDEDIKSMDMNELIAKITNKKERNKQKEE